MSDSEHSYGTFDLQCQIHPSDKFIKWAKRLFGEGFTWTCPSCFKQYVLTQGKGKRWFWQDVLFEKNKQTLQTTGCICGRDRPCGGPHDCARV